MADSQIETLMLLASDDVEAFNVLSERESLHAIAGFHAQQAVEKAMKAVLLFKVANFPLTHNLGVLWDLCAESGATPSVSKFDVVQLIPYAVEGRYNALIEGVSIDELRQTMTATLTWARALLPSSFQNKNN
jgi:HEPN domain-containing protein